jgi:hypothetical protein
MKTRHTLIAAAMAALLGGLTVPVLAETSGGSQTMPGHDMGTARMGHGMSGGMMSGGDMSGCMGMMRSMNNGDGRPNSQWQKHTPGDRSMPN